MSAKAKAMDYSSAKVTDCSSATAKAPDSAWR
jgi:hypothetical protein